MPPIPWEIVTMWSPARSACPVSREEALGSFLPIVPEGAAEDATDRIGRVCRGEPATNVLLTAQKKTRDDRAEHFHGALVTSPE